MNKIVHLITSLNVGGVETMLQRLLAHRDRDRRLLQQRAQAFNPDAMTDQFVGLFESDWVRTDINKIKAIYVIVSPKVRDMRYSWYMLDCATLFCLRFPVR